MRIETDGWIAGVRRMPSPNCDPRPSGAVIDLLVLHGISLPAGEFGGPHIDALFCNCLATGAHPSFRELTGLRVSAHLLIDRGGALTQYVSFHERAWHAGRSAFVGREACNDYSIGIELEGCDERPYSDAQYDTLNRVVDVITRRWPAISGSRIVGHCDIAPGRKTDPGPAFDWSRLLARRATPRPDTA